MEKNYFSYQVANDFTKDFTEDFTKNLLPNGFKEKGLVDICDEFLKSGFLGCLKDLDQ